MTTCKLCNGTGEWYGNDGQAGPFKCDPCPDPLKDCKAYIEWHEMRMKQFNKMPVTVGPDINDELLEALKNAEADLNAMAKKFQCGVRPYSADVAKKIIARAEAKKVG